MALTIEAQGFAIRRKTDGKYVAGKAGHFSTLPRLFDSMKSVKQHLNQYAYRNFRSILTYRYFLQDCEVVDIATGNPTGFDIKAQINQRIDKLKAKSKEELSVHDLIPCGDGSFKW